MPTQKIKTMRRTAAVLKTAADHAGTVDWPALKTAGHHFSSVRSCLHAGELEEIAAYTYKLTDAGRDALAIEET